MEELKKIPRITRIILTMSILIPVLFTMSPFLSEYLYFDAEYLKRLQIWRLITGIFVSTFDINLVFILLTRYQILKFIEMSKLQIDAISHEIELTFFILSFSFTLFLANFISELGSFNQCINMALVNYMCRLCGTDNMISFFGFSISPIYFPYFYGFYEYIISKGTSKFYYGLIHSVSYIYLRKKLFKIPQCYINFYTYILSRINCPKGFKGVGRKIGKKQ
ncbi:hypothetical protein CWI37_1279p0010 [Hamiltosporidium tvaerminnensis]|uniref:Derlin n=1 Tax=Hamiltosporidium tvaerminnensis TaxID=1176355 RepID=A0A4Q9KY73_9MICR|nr:hypothetical protein CWI37_1279p0010 [Hamiltosporidium tvaerminnensis]